MDFRGEETSWFTRQTLLPRDGSGVKLFFLRKHTSRSDRIFGKFLEIGSTPPELTASDDMRPCVGQRYDWRSDWELLNGINYSCFHPVKSFVEKPNPESFAVALQHFVRNRAARHSRIRAISSAFDPNRSKVYFWKRRIRPVFYMSYSSGSAAWPGEGRLN